MSKLSYTRSKRVEPECVRLLSNGKAGHADKPPVRVFLGTEAGQMRAERVFVWSIEKVRDPARLYEIYLMKDLAGFNQRGWTTGFTNYRFGIPAFAHGAGRAIYNDVDQIYLEDPARLFDMDMGDHGFLAIGEKESSVMLIDCEKMAKVWSLNDAYQVSKKKMLAKALAVPGLFGPLGKEWNARDEEFDPEKSKLLHFTTLHTQPWQPFPEDFIYDEHPWAHVWLSLEQEADRAGRHVFTKANPSEQFRKWFPSAVEESKENSVQKTPENSVQPSDSDEYQVRGHHEVLQELLQHSGAQTVLSYGASANGSSLEATRVGTNTSWVDQVLKNGCQIEIGGPFGLTREDSGVNRFDGVVCMDFLGNVPDDDVPWVLDDLFSRARCFVYACVTDGAKNVSLLSGQACSAASKSLFWWEARFSAVSKKYPHMYWLLAARATQNNQPPNWQYRQGGPLPGGALPAVWVLLDDRPGNTTQAIGLAKALDLPFQTKSLKFNKRASICQRLGLASLMGVVRDQSDELIKPWPDLVIAAGQRSAPVSRWIKEQSHGRTRLVHLGRKGGCIAEHFDLVITPSYCNLPPSLNRISTVVPLNRITPKVLEEAKNEFQQLMGDGTRQRIVLLVGGETSRYRLDQAVTKRMGQELVQFAESQDGQVFALTSRRTSPEAIESLRLALGGNHHVEEWKPKAKRNPYLAYLASADLIVVTGESESMLAEVAATGKPMYIYRLPEKRTTLSRKIGEWVLARARRRPSNNRGTARPQQRLEYVCAWSIARGWVLPPRDLSALHQSLIRLGIATFFGNSSIPHRSSELSEAEQTADRVRDLLGIEHRHFKDYRVNCQACVQQN